MQAAHHEAEGALRVSERGDCAAGHEGMQRHYTGEDVAVVTVMMAVMTVMTVMVVVIVMTVMIMMAVVIVG